MVIDCKKAVVRLYVKASTGKWLSPLSLDKAGAGAKLQWGVMIRKRALNELCR